MYSKLEKFLRVNVYNEANPSMGYLAKQPYAIDGYEVVNDIRDLSKQVYELRDETMVKAQELYKKLLQPAKSTGIIGGWFGSKTQVEAKPKKVKSQAQAVKVVEDEPVGQMQPQ